MKEIILEQYEVTTKTYNKAIKIDEADFVYQASRYKDEKNNQGIAFSYAEFKQFKRIDDALAKLDESNRVLKLDDSDFDFLLLKLKDNKWSNAADVLVSAVVKLVQKFENAK